MYGSCAALKLMLLGSASGEKGLSSLNDTAMGGVPEAVLPVPPPPSKPSPERDCIPTLLPPLTDVAVFLWRLGISDGMNCTSGGAGEEEGRDATTGEEEVSAAFSMALLLVRTLVVLLLLLLLVVVLVSATV